jgi:hypothetical protein
MFLFRIYLKRNKHKEQNQRKEIEMSNMEKFKITDDQLKEVSGGLYGGSSGQWRSAMVKRPGGVFSCSKSGGGFTQNGRFVIPQGEYFTVDMSRRAGNYAVAFYNDQEGWIDLTGVNLI